MHPIDDTLPPDDLGLLAQAATGLLMPSETDAPFVPFRWPGVAPLTEATLRTTLGVAADIPIATRDVMSGRKTAHHVAVLAHRRGYRALQDGGLPDWYDRNHDATDRTRPHRRARWAAHRAGGNMSGIRRIVAALVLLAAALLGSQPVQATDATAQLLLGNPSGAVADPASPTNELIAREQYVVGYHRDRGIPTWVSWHLEAADLGPADRFSGSFITDTSLPTGWYRANIVTIRIRAMIEVI